MAWADQISDFLQRPTPLTRSCLLAELERLELCGVDMPKTADIQAKLRAEFCKDGLSQNRATPSRYFFAPLEPLLVDGAPEHANSGRIGRGSLTPIWEWICRDLLRTMARDYNAQMKDLIAGDRQREAQQAAAAFQIKVIKSLEAVEHHRDRDGVGRGGDVGGLLAAGRLGGEPHQLPGRLEAQGDQRQREGDRVGVLLGEGIEQRHHLGDLRVVEFRQLGRQRVIEFGQRLACAERDDDLGQIAIHRRRRGIGREPGARLRRALGRAERPLEDKRLVLLLALKHNRVVIARDTLTEIYEIEYALQVRIDEFAASEWGRRLQEIMDTIAALVEAEISRFPDEVGHVLGSRSLRHHQSLGGRISYLAWKGRDAITDSVSFCKGLIGQS